MKHTAFMLHLSFIYNMHMYIFLSFSLSTFQSLIINYPFRVRYLGGMMENIGLEQR